MSEHTKGPWEARWSERGQYWFIDHPQQEGSATLTKLDCDEADARLIAAAPDMYHALQDLIAYLGVDVDNGLDELLTNARAAIAKATGQEV
jgi:hypothetical protein